MKKITIELSDRHYEYLEDKWDTTKHAEDKTQDLKQYINSKISELIEDEIGKEMAKADQYEGAFKDGEGIVGGERMKTPKFP